MGSSWSSRRRTQYPQNQLLPQNHNPSPVYHFPLPPPPPPPPPQSSYSYYANASPPVVFPPQPLPYPGHHNYAIPYPANLPNNQADGWSPAPYVDHSSAKKVKNEVNVHKDTIKLHFDENSPGTYLVSFTFDALADGSITIFYFAKEGPNCIFTPLYIDIYKPVKIPFNKGPGQRFTQPPGTGMDLGFFSAEELSKPSSDEEVFPLIIYADTQLSSKSVDGQPSHCLPEASTRAQITQAVLNRDDRGHIQVKVIKQILLVDGARYELREIYGRSSAGKASFGDTDAGKECVICMTEPKDTAVLPCRHMCLCGTCAKELRLQSNKCPICRQPIQELLEIKVNEESQ